MQKERQDPIDSVQEPPTNNNQLEISSRLFEESFPRDKSVSNHTDEDSRGRHDHKEALVPWAKDHKHPGQVSSSNNLPQLDLHDGRSPANTQEISGNQWPWSTKQTAKVNPLPNSAEPIKHEGDSVKDNSLAESIKSELSKIGDLIDATFGKGTYGPTKTGAIPQKIDQKTGKSFAQEAESDVSKLNALMNQAFGDNTDNPKQNTPSNSGKSHRENSDKPTPGSKAPQNEISKPHVNKQDQSGESYYKNASRLDKADISLMASDLCNKGLLPLLDKGGQGAFSKEDVAKTLGMVNEADGQKQKAEVEASGKLTPQQKQALQNIYAGYDGLCSSDGKVHLDEIAKKAGAADWKSLQSSIEGKHNESNSNNGNTSGGLTAEKLAAGQEETAKAWNTRQFGSEAITARLVKDGFRAEGKNKQDGIAKFADESREKWRFKEFGKNSCDFINTFSKDKRFEQINKSDIKESDLKRGDVLVWPKDSKHPYGLSKVYLGNGKVASDHISSLEHDFNTMGDTKPTVFRLKDNSDSAQKPTPEIQPKENNNINADNKISSTQLSDDPSSPNYYKFKEKDGSITDLRAIAQSGFPPAWDHYDNAPSHGLNSVKDTITNQARGKGEWTPDMQRRFPELKNDPGMHYCMMVDGKVVAQSKDADVAQEGASTTKVIHDAVNLIVHNGQLSDFQLKEAMAKDAYSLNQLVRPIQKECSQDPVHDPTGTKTIMNHMPELGIYHSKPTWGPNRLAPLDGANFMHKVMTNDFPGADKLRTIMGMCKYGQEKMVMTAPKDVLVFHKTGTYNGHNDLGGCVIRGADGKEHVVTFSCQTKHPSKDIGVLFGGLLKEQGLDKNYPAPKTANAEKQSEAESPANKIENKPVSSENKTSQETAAKKTPDSILPLLTINQNSFAAEKSRHPSNTAAVQHLEPNPWTLNTKPDHPIGSGLNNELSSSKPSLNLLANKTNINQSDAALELRELISNGSELNKMLDPGNKGSFNKADINNALEKTISATDKRTLRSLLVDYDVLKNKDGSMSLDGLSQKAGASNLSDFQKHNSPDSTKPNDGPEHKNSQDNVIGPGPHLEPKQLYDYFIGKGFTSAQAAGILGNIEAESSFNTKAYNADEGAIGLCQWEGPRRTALEHFASQQGKSVNDGQVQADFLMHELNTSEKSACQALKAAETPEQAARAFQSRFERSASLGNRAVYARKYFNEFKNETPKVQPQTNEVPNPQNHPKPSPGVPSSTNTQYKLDDPRTWTEAQKSIVAAAKSMADNRLNINEKAWHYNRDNEGGNDGGGRRGGVTACDESVLGALKLADMNAGVNVSPGASALGRLLEQKGGWNEVPKQQVQNGDIRPGDVIVWKPGHGYGMGHIGVVVPSTIGGQSTEQGKYAGLDCVNNSSKYRHAVSNPLNEQLKDPRDFTVLRPPSNTNDGGTDHRDPSGWVHGGHTASSDHAAEAQRMEEHYAQFRNEIAAREAALNQAETANKPANAEPSKSDQTTHAISQTPPAPPPIPQAQPSEHQPKPAAQPNEINQRTNHDDRPQVQSEDANDKKMDEINAQYQLNENALKANWGYYKVFKQAKSLFEQRQAAGQIPTLQQFFEQAKAVAQPGQKYFEASVPIYTQGGNAIGENFMWNKDGKLIGENQWTRSCGDQLGQIAHKQDTVIYNHISTTGPIDAPNAAGSHLYKSDPKDNNWIKQNTRENQGNTHIDSHPGSMHGTSSIGCEAHPTSHQYPNWQNYFQKMKLAMQLNYQNGQGAMATWHVGTEYAVKSNEIQSRM